LLLDHLIGQQRATTVLRNAIRRGRVAHAYLFHGPQSVGKSTAALLFAQYLNCEALSPGEDGHACGECRSCRLIASGTHPDVRFLTPADGSGQSVIPIETIRDEFVYDVNLRPVVGRYKVYVIDPTERTAPLAIHTILKVLEEPPRYAVTILVSSVPAALPATIPSRCQQIAFQLAGIAPIERHLVKMGLKPAEAASLARLSGGRVAWAIRAAQRPEVLAARRNLLDLCAGVQARGLPASLRTAEEIRLQAADLARAQVEAGSKLPQEEDVRDQTTSPLKERAVRAELPWCLDVMVSWYRDLLAVRQGAALLNPDYESALRERAGARADRRTEHAIERILGAKRSIERNANLDLALESLAIELAGGGE